LIFTLSFSMACNGDNSGDNGGVNTPTGPGAEEESALNEFVPTYVYTDGIHDKSAKVSEDTWLVKNGVSDFAIIMPSVLSSEMKTAKKEFDLLFEDATGLTLPSIADTSDELTVDGKYISFGENAWFKKMNKNPSDEGYDATIHITDAEIDYEHLKIEGVRIITKKNITYFLGNSDVAIINAVYTFMELHFNYEFFYRDTITIDTNVLDEKALVFNVKDVPDIDRRVRNIPSYDLGNEKFPYDLSNGFIQDDINNQKYRARLTGGHDVDLLGTLYYDNWNSGSYGLIHNVEEFYEGFKKGITNINDTRYVNWDKYWYDEYIPTGELYTATGEIQYDRYAIGRIGNPDADAYVADVDGDGVVDTDENGDGIPDSWGDWGNGISDAQKNIDRDNNGIGDWYEFGDQKEHENASLGQAKGSLGDLWVGPSPCYTCKGNTNAYQAMVKRLAECVMQSAIRFPVDKYPYKNTMLFSIEDAGEPCSCDWCKEDYMNSDASYCGSVNRLLNDVMEQYVLPWMAKAENEAYDRRANGFTMGYFVYHNLTNAPVWQDENGNNVWDPAMDCKGYEYVKDAQGNIDWDKTKERWNVSIYFAGGYRSGENGWYDKNNKKARHCMDEWRSICNDFMIWDYPSYQYGYAYFYDTVATWNNDYYSMLASIGCYFIFAESCDNGDFACDWQTLNSYVQSELMWDCSQPVGELTRKYFDAMYLDAADTMLGIYNSMRVYKQWMKDQLNIRDGAGGQVMGQTKFWPLPILQSWIDGMYQAIDEIAKYETINNGLYLQVRDHIHIEMATPVMITMALYRDNITKEDYDKYKSYMLYMCSIYNKIVVKAGSEADFKGLANKL
ncbi:MAG: DUF4838 domain-containing protein, partial [Clostridia bacterium]|nr:DUF4838 domain-containing protein [Clostridia bacterium]